MKYYIYNEITQKVSQEIAERIAELDEIEINSNGGDVFAAIAIVDTLKNSGHAITLCVKGLCASAATLLLCSGQKVIAAAGSLFMIHSPQVMLNDSYTAEDLDRLKTTLEKVKETIQSLYESRLKKSVNLEREEWYTAQEAKDLGLIDEIGEPVEMTVDAAHNLLFVNKCCFKMAMRGLAQHEETRRIRELEELSGNPAADAIVMLAIKKGAYASEVREYIEAVSKVTLKNYPQMKAAEQLIAVVRDQIQSGAGKVKGESAENKSARHIEMVAKYANEGIKR